MLSLSRRGFVHPSKYVVESRGRSAPTPIRCTRSRASRRSPRRGPWCCSRGSPTRSRTNNPRSYCSSRTCRPSRGWSCMSFPGAARSGCRYRSPPSSGDCSRRLETLRRSDRPCPSKAPRGSRARGPGLAACARERRVVSAGEIELPLHDVVAAERERRIHRGRCRSVARRILDRDERRVRGRDVLARRGRRLEGDRGAGPELLRARGGRVFQALYIAKVGCGKTLSQSPPMTVHFQFVVFATCPICLRRPPKLVPSTGVMFVGAGYGASTIAAVGHVTGAGWQVQFWTSLFSGTPSQCR